MNLNAVTQYHPRFDVKVPPSGYHWWYIDALSDDGHYGVSIIAFIGSVFSPYYAWRGRNNPENHVSFNVALYNKRARRWTMTERGQTALQRKPNFLTIGPSSLSWDGKTILIEFDEISFPVPHPTRGTVKLTPRWTNPQSFNLDAQRNHHWWPIAPICHAEISLERPALSWRGSGYFDSNWGSEPIEKGFHRWDWSRMMLPDNEAAILYDITRLDREQYSLALHFDKNGHLESFIPPPRARLPNTFYQLNRFTQCEAGFNPQVIETLEDTHFYQRSCVKTKLLGHVGRAMHESMALFRFKTRWAKCLLPFKMPRKA